jgi:hypothetical protein
MAIDVPIWSYLEKLKFRRERISDYKGIWYYYLPSCF